MLLNTQQIKFFLSLYGYLYVFLQDREIVFLSSEFVICQVTWLDQWMISKCDANEAYKMCASHGPPLLLSGTLCSLLCEQA